MTTLTPLAAPHWCKQLHQLRPRAPHWVAPWLVERGSLTRRVTRACPGHLTVTVVKEGWGRPHTEESYRLGLARCHRAWLREVHLRCDDQPWVYARTVIPVATLQGPAGHLMRLGNRPLGAVLFADPTVQRGPLELASLDRRHHLYRLASFHLTGLPNELWGRRSLFWLGGQPLLVAEVFLPVLRWREERC